MRSSISENLGALHILHDIRLAQLTLAHFEHCQSSALKSPLLFSAAAFPISDPCPLCFEESSRSLLQRLHRVRLAKFKFLQLRIDSAISSKKNNSEVVNKKKIGITTI